MTDEWADQMIVKTEGYVQQRAGAQALESANELADIDPKDAIVWYLKGKAHYVAGEYDEALSALSKAATLQADQPAIWLVMGYCLLALRRYPEAQPSLEYVKGVEPDNLNATAALCALHIILGNGPAAKTYFDQGLQIDQGAFATILGKFNEQFFAQSPAVEADTKAALLQLLDAARRVQ